MDYVLGEIFTPNGFVRGYLGFDRERIIDIGRGSPLKTPKCKGLVVPTFINSHTHIGDAFIRYRKIELPKTIEKLVAPPSGLKHQLLNKASDDEIISGMEEAIGTMIKTGTTCFCDFRENGLEGITQLKKSMKNSSISSLILSRPKELKYDKDEVELLLNHSEGIGVSSISDWKYSELEKVAKHTRKRKKIFALHASERVREDIDLILDLKPDFLIHMVFASDDDLELVKDENLPIVVCPQSNIFYGLKPNLKLFKKHDIDLLVGTDNAMLHTPRLLDEIRCIKSMSREFSLTELLNMMTYNPRKALNLDQDILGFNSPSEFVVLSKKNLEPIYVSSCRWEGEI